jgi:hypothetical protein
MYIYLPTYTYLPIYLSTYLSTHIYLCRRTTGSVFPKFQSQKEKLLLTQYDKYIYRDMARMESLERVQKEQDKCIDLKIRITK